MANKELLDRSQADQALRDLMPVVEWLTAANQWKVEGSNRLFEKQLHKAYAAFCLIPERSPAIKAYIRWLEYNTNKHTG